MKKFDVIIIGAGPGGLNCAGILSRTDLKILVLEKNSLIGPKVCAGGLLDHSIEYLNPPEAIIEKRFDKIKFFAPGKERTLDLSKPNTLCTVDRKKLAEFQLDKIKRDNAVILKNKRVTQITNDHVVINNSQKMYFRYLVGADGSNSMTRKYLGLPNKNKGIGLQYIISSDRFKDIEIHFDSKLFHAWYAWIFPRKDLVSIGTGGNLKRLPPGQIKKNLDNWLRERKIDVSDGEFQAFPINSDFRGFQFNNIFLVGDAAGLASEFSGEGIYQALISGEEAARKIMDNTHVPLKLKKVLSRHRLHRFLSFSLRNAGRSREALFRTFINSLKYKKLSNAAMRFFA